MQFKFKCLTSLLPYTDDSQTTFQPPSPLFRAAPCTKGIRSANGTDSSWPLCAPGRTLLSVAFKWSSNLEDLSHFWWRVEMRTDTVRPISWHFVLAVSRSHLNAVTRLGAQSKLCGTCGRNDAGQISFFTTFAFLARIVQPSSIFIYNTTKLHNLSAWWRSQNTSHYSAS
jgi:hypothetical protein